MVVPEKLESASVQLVGPALHRERRHTAKSVGVFGRIVVRDQLELGNGIYGWIYFRIVGDIAAAQSDAIDAPSPVFAPTRNHCAGDDNHTDLVVHDPHARKKRIASRRSVTGRNRPA